VKLVRRQEAGGSDAPSELPPEGSGDESRYWRDVGSPSGMQPSLEEAGPDPLVLPVTSKVPVHSD